MQWEIKDQITHLHNMNESQNHCEQKQPDTKEHAVGSHLYEYVGQPKRIQSEKGQKGGCRVCESSLW